MTKLRSYSELRGISTFAERFDYLSLAGVVGKETFGWDRHLNQAFYRSREWRSIRYHVIDRDNGCDLGIEGFEIPDRISIHHMNPMTISDIADANEQILDPEFLISTTHKTHNAIHYGDRSQIPRQFVERRPGDTRLW